jgi:hypothetical protein
MPNTLSRRFFNVWVDMEQADRLEKLAAEKGVGVGDVVREVLTPLLAGEDEQEEIGRYVLLKIPDRTYRTHIKFFDGDADQAVASMVGAIEVNGEDFAAALKSVKGR